MLLKIKKSFEKDVSKVTDKEILIKLLDVIEIIVNSNKLNDIANIKKLKGFKNFYRMRLGDFRIGFQFKNNTIELIRFLERKDIYNKFP